MGRAAHEPLRRADFTLGEDHLALEAAFAAMLDRHCPPEVVRAAEPVGYDPALVATLASMRAIAMAVPAEHGGDGAGLTELTIVGEQLGRHLAPVPYAEACAAARLLARSDEPRALGWLAGALDGTRLVTFCPGDTGPREERLVAAGAVADAVIARHEGELVLVAPARRPAHVPNHGRLPLASMRLGADDGSRIRLAEGEQARRLSAVAEAELQVLSAATLTGMAEGALRIGVRHAQERHAFGVPIGFFQAVSNRLVDVAIAVTAARRLVQKAAWLADNDPEASAALIPMAHQHAARTAMRAATETIHVLGGVGCTEESDATLYFRRAKATALLVDTASRSG